MRRTIGISVLVLGAILMGALAAGTPVAGNDSVAATTAGIELGTSPARHTSTTAAMALPRAVRPVLVLLRLLIAAIALAVGLREIVPSLRSVLCWQTVARRGPPVLA